MNDMKKQQAVKQIKRYFDHDAAKQILKEKYEAKMLFTAFGGLWKAGPELLTLLQSTNYVEMVILDQYGNPCKVERKALFDLVEERWYEQMNGWYTEYSGLQNKR